MGLLHPLVYFHVTLFIEFVPLGVKGPRSKLRRLKIIYLDGSAEKAIATLLLLFS